MTTYKEIELKKMFEHGGEVTIDIEDSNGNTTQETFTNFDECKNAILIYENDCNVYF